LLAGHRRTSLEADYDAHEKAWVANGFALREDTPEPKRIVNVVAQILKKTAAPPA
jgi:hypothetical protein